MAVTTDPAVELAKQYPNSPYGSDKYLTQRLKDEVIAPVKEWSANRDPKDPWGLANLPGPAVPRQIPLGMPLPKVERNQKIPGTAGLPPGIMKMWTKDRPDDWVDKRRPKLYILLIPGASDQVEHGWAKLEFDAPDFVEIITYEHPGSGVRKQEPYLRGVKDLGADVFDAFKDIMSTGHFVVAGHSIGVMLLTYLCIRAERELGVKPQAVFMMDRAPPHRPVFSDYGMDMLINRPDKWYQMYGAYDMDEDQSLESEQTWEKMHRWVIGEMISNDIIPVGTYKFPCRLFVFQAAADMAGQSNMLRNPYETAMQYSEEAKSKFQWNCEVRNKYYANGRGCNYDAEWLEEFKDWADYSRIYKCHCDHANIKTDNRTWAVILREVRDIIWRAEQRMLQAQASRSG